MSDRLFLHLGDVFVGEITRLNDDKVDFEIDEAYRADPNRPVLSQSFLTDDGGVANLETRAAAGQVPSFFSNLLPEGALRSYLAREAGLRETQEFELLGRLGLDLPGDVTVTRDRSGFTPASPIRADEDDAARPTRFSLAGVQLKFSAIQRQRVGMTIPAHGLGGQWIVKLPSNVYRAMPENEFSIMSMAANVGIEIPEIQLVSLAEMEGLPPEVSGLDESVGLAVKRFDRELGRRIHIEDFAQALAQSPMEKYNPQLNTTDLTRLIATVCNEEDVLEFSRRLMFNTIVGNGDMHLKNWSFIYRDGKTPTLSPAYDLLCTTVYIPNDGLALRLGSARNWRDLRLEDFATVAAGAGVERNSFLGAAVDTVTRFRESWEDWTDELPVNERLKQSIQNQLDFCPAIASASR